jgi:hypothetical protein
MSLLFLYIARLLKWMLALVDQIKSLLNEVDVCVVLMAVGCAVQRQRALIQGFNRTAFTATRA